MYKLTDQEATLLGAFLRILCRMDRLEDAKRIADMSDAQLSIVIRSDSLWDLVLDHK